MRPLVVLLALAALAAATPMVAFADPGGGHGRGRDEGGRGQGGGQGGNWQGRGEGRGDRGGPQGGGQAPYGGGRWRDEGPPPGRSEAPPPYGNGRGAYPAPYPYGEPQPRGRNSNSLGQYYREQQDEAREGRRGGNIPMGQVMQNIRRRMPGRLLDAGLEQWRDGRPVYRVRWGAADGRRIDYIIDARTGAILEEEQ